MDEVFPQVQEEPKQEAKKKSVEIFSVDELEKLPDGVCLLSEDEFETGAGVVGRILRDKILAKNITPILIDTAKNKEKQPEYLIGPLLANMHQNRAYRKIVDELSEEFPNLCWFRGATYLENSAGSPVMTRLETFGANGYLGDLRATNYAENDYDHASHANPVLFIITLADILKGVDSDAIGLGTEHDYDVLIFKKEHYDEWAINNIGICDLGNSPEDFAKAKKILRSKATIVK